MNLREIARITTKTKLIIKQIDSSNANREMK